MATMWINVSLRVDVQPDGSWTPYDDVNEEMAAAVLWEFEGWERKRPGFMASFVPGFALINHDDGSSEIRIGEKVIGKREGSGAWTPVK